MNKPNETNRPRYADIIQKARESEETAPEQEAEEMVIPEPPSARVVEEMVNLSIRVPKRLRMHWVAEAKRHDTSITAVVTEALNTRFGTPR